MEVQELILLTSKLTETKNFYNQTIGFEIIQESETSISFAVGSSKLVFELTDKIYDPVYHFAFNIPANKIEEAIDWTLQRASLVFMNNSYITNFEKWNARSIYFFDNNQNILEFIMRRDLNNESDNTFSVNSILNINEIGLVSDEPIITGKEIMKQTGIDFFSKGPVSESFVAVGDEEGLFVISNPKRNWYPTQDLAAKWKVKVKLKVAEKVHELEFNG